MKWYTLVFETGVGGPGGGEVAAKTGGDELIFDRGANKKQKQNEGGEERTPMASQREYTRSS